MKRKPGRDEEKKEDREEEANKRQISLTQRIERQFGAGNADTKKHMFASEYFLSFLKDRILPGHVPEDLFGRNGSAHQRVATTCLADMFQLMQEKGATLIFEPLSTTTTCYFSHEPIDQANGVSVLLSRTPSDERTTESLLGRFTINGQRYGPLVEAMFELARCGRDVGKLCLLFKTFKLVFF